MARDGSGNYSRTQSDYVFDTVISETAVNSELNDIATELTVTTVVLAPEARKRIIIPVA